MPSFRIRAPFPDPGSPKLEMAGDDLIITYPEPQVVMAQDEAPTFKYPRAALAGAHGGQDQGEGDPDGNVAVASSPGRCIPKLFALLAGKLSQEDLDAVQSLVQELLSTTDPSNGNSGGMAADRHRGPTYAERFPNANRLVRVFSIPLPGGILCALACSRVHWGIVGVSASE